MKLNFKPKDILDKNFKVKPNGYDASEVDSFLDLVLDDYRIVDDVINNLNNEISSLTKQITNLERDLEISKQNTLKQKNQTFVVNDYSRLDNIDLLKKISLYEIKLYELGVDPSKIK